MDESTPMKILVVENESDTSSEIRDVLEKNGFIVTGVVFSSDEAYDSIRKEAPDIMLADIVLRGPIDGIDTVKLIQEKYDIPVIFMSTGDSIEQLSRIKQTHPYGYIKKPFRGSDLVMVIEIAVERHRLYRRNRLNEQKYRFIFESIQDVYFEVSMAGIIIEVSPSVINIFGSSREELIGRNIMEYLVDENDGAAFLDIGKHEKRGKLSGVGLVKKDTSIALCDISIAVVYNRSGMPVKMVGSISDVTSRIMNEDILQNAHREIEDILLSMNTIIIGVSLQDKVTHWNREAELALKIKAAEAIGSQVTMLRINWDWGRIYEGIARAMLNDCSINLQEVRYATVPGAERSSFLNIKITPIRDFSGGVKGFILSGDDITENRAMRIRSNQSQKLESIGQLASGIAHEINTPTQYINDNTLFLKKAFTKIVPYIDIPDNADDKDARDIRFYLEEIPKAIDQSIEGIGKISAIVGSVKQFSHPGTQKKIPYDVLKIVNDVVTITRNEWKYVSDVNVSASDNIPLLSCHPNVISQVLVNMIVNSAQSIAEKFGTVADKQGKIGISVSSSPDYIEIKVTDNGKGIPENIKDRIFDPFFTTKDVGKGTGQGLAIAYSAITTMHGGTIMVDSVVNDGTVFTIRLPFGADAESSDEE